MGLIMVGQSGWLFVGSARDAELALRVRRCRRPRRTSTGAAEAKRRRRRVCGKTFHGLEGGAGQLDSNPRVVMMSAAGVLPRRVGRCTAHASGWVCSARPREKGIAVTFLGATTRQDDLIHDKGKKKHFNYSVEASVSRN